MKGYLNRWLLPLMMFAGALINTPQLHAQVIKEIEKAIEDDTAKKSILSEIDAATTPSNTIDSTTLLQKELAQKDSLLQEYKLQQANQYLEIEGLKEQITAQDSLKREKLKVEIDSMRSLIKGVPLVIDEDTLFYIYAKRGGIPPSTRVINAEIILKKLGKKYTLEPDSVYVANTDILSDIMYKSDVILTITDLDALWENTNRKALAEKWRNDIVNELKILKSQHSLLKLFERIGLFILVIVIQVLLCTFISRMYRKLKRHILEAKQTKLKPVKIKDYELLNQDRMAHILVLAFNVLRYGIIALLLTFTIPILFAIFPATKPLAMKIFSYMWNPVKIVFSNVFDYLPNLVMIAVIYISIRFLVKMVKFFMDEIESKRLTISGFYPDWAQPTYHILRFLLYAFMVAMVYPYLPGSDSRVFQGISVFVGIIVSLGSSTVIANIVAGMVITYMRPFKLGDRVKLNDVVGDVIEKSPFVTRIRTPKNELVTIPNSFIISSHSVNMSASARDFGLIIHTTVTIGYDVPWRQVHQLLIDAALATPGIEKDPSPFVLETGLNDWYPAYQINAYITDASRQPRILSALMQNIQDTFNKAGVEIMSPTYIATRDGNQVTIPKPGPYNPIGSEK